MQSLAYIPGSNGAGSASLMTVQNVRSPGATDILVNTVTGAPTKFFATMGAPHTFVDPVTNETITIISEATAVDFAGHIDTGKVVIDVISPGYADTRGSAVGDIVVIRPITEWANNLFNLLSQSLQDNGKLKESAYDYDPNITDNVTNGGIWSLSTGLNGAMTAFTGYITGRLNTIPAIASRAFTASKDTYVDVLRNTTTGAFSLVYTEVANGAASPTLAANSLRLAKVVTSAGTITSTIQTGNIDSLGNMIRPTGTASTAKLQSSIKFRVSRATVTNTQSTELQNLVFDTKLYDTGNNFNMTTGIFTVPISGYYKLAGQLSVGSLASGAQCWTFFTKNGGSWLRGQRLSDNGGSATPYLRHDIEEYLNAGDAIGFGIFTTGGAQPIEPGLNICYFYGHLMSVS